LLTTFAAFALWPLKPLDALWAEFAPLPHVTLLAALTDQPALATVALKPLHATFAHRPRHTIASIAAFAWRLRQSLLEHRDARQQRIDGCRNRLSHDGREAGRDRHQFVVGHAAAIAFCKNSEARSGVTG
jgi:hypothetical protein